MKKIFHIFCSPDQQLNCKFQFLTSNMFPMANMSVLELMLYIRAIIAYVVKLSKINNVYEKVISHIL